MKSRSTSLVEARAALGQLLPRDEIRGLRSVGNGWDHNVFEAQGVAYRFPRTGRAARMLELEAAVLPSIAPLVPLAVPRTRVLGQFGPGYLDRVAAHEFLPGRSACERRPGPETRVAWARPLGEFYRALHSIDVNLLGVELPGDELGRIADPAKRVRWTRPTLHGFGEAGLLQAARVRDLLARLDPELPPSPRAPVLVHADAHLRNLLCDGALQLTGFIDFVDLHLGDPALDLAAAFTVLPPEGREAFFDAYGGVDATTVQRARFRAIDHSVRAWWGSRPGSTHADPDMVWAARQVLTWAAS